MEKFKNGKQLVGEVLFLNFAPKASILNFLTPPPTLLPLQHPSLEA